MPTNVVSAILLSKNTHLAYLKDDSLKLWPSAMFMMEKKVVHGRADEVKSGLRGPSFRSPASLCPTDHGTSIFNHSSTTEAGDIDSIPTVLDPCH